MTRVAAAALLARALGVPLPGARTSIEELDLGATPGGAPLSGRLWAPERPAPAVVLAGGITPQGVEDPRLVRLATALAATPRVVFAPRLVLAQRRLDHDDIDRIALAARRLREDPRVDGGVVLLGFSFGGSYALVAASRPEVAETIDRVGAFGAYASLAELLPQVRDLEDLRGYIDGARDEGSLTAEEHAAIVAVLDRGAPVERLPTSLRRRLDELSPVEVGEVAVPVSLAHARGDPVIPHGELRHLAAAIPHARTYEVELFTHVDFRPTPARLRQAVADLTELWRFARDILGDR